MYGKCRHPPSRSTHLLQVIDYGCAIKFDKMAKFARPQIAMFRLMCMIGEHHYQSSTAVMLCVQRYQTSKGLVMSDILAHNLGAVVEEPGEILFSCLARCVVGDTMQQQFAHLNTMFKLLSVFRETISDFEDDVGISGGGTGYVIIKKSSAEVRAVRSFMKGHIRKIIAGVKCMYGNMKDKQMKGGVTLKAVQAKQRYEIDAYIPRIYIADIEDKVRGVFEIARSQVDTHYSEQFHDIWDFTPKDTLFPDAYESDEIVQDFDAASQVRPSPVQRIDRRRRPIASDEADEEKVEDGDEDKSEDDVEHLQKWTKIHSRKFIKGDWCLHIEWEDKSKSWEIETRWRKQEPHWTEVFLDEWFAKKGRSQDSQKRKAARRRKEDGSFKPKKGKNK
jgi:hypothetical protein